MPDIYLARLPNLSQPLDLAVECYSSDSEIESLALYHAELIEHIPFREVPRIELISHHFAHRWSVLWPSGFEQAAVMIIDFMGSPIDHLTEEWTRPPGARGTDVGKREWASVSSIKRLLRPCFLVKEMRAR